MRRMRRQAAGVETSTEGLLDELLAILSGTNGLLAAIDNIEMGIHEASAEGEQPVSEAANDVIGVLDAVRPDLERARETLLGRLDVLVGAGTPAPPPPPEPEEEEEEELEEEFEEELPEE